MTELNARLPLRDETREDLRNFKREGETWDDLLCRLANYAAEHEHEQAETHG